VQGDIEIPFNRRLITNNIATAHKSLSAYSNSYLKVILPRQSSQPVNSLRLVLKRLKMVQAIWVPVLWVAAELYLSVLALASRAPVARALVRQAVTV